MAPNTARAAAKDAGEKKVMVTVKCIAIAKVDGGWAGTLGDRRIRDREKVSISIEKGAKLPTWLVPESEYAAPEAPEREPETVHTVRGGLGKAPERADDDVLG